MFCPKLKLLYNAVKEKLGLSVMFKLFEECVINVVSFQKKIVVVEKLGGWSQYNGGGSRKY